MNDSPLYVYFRLTSHVICYQESVNKLALVTAITFRFECTIN